MKFKLITSCLAVGLLLTGCGSSTKEEEGKGMRDTSDFENTRFENGSNRNMTDNVSNRSDKQYNVSKEAADRIKSDIPEVKSAYVLTENNNAYVGLILENGQGGSTKGEMTGNTGSKGDMTKNRDSNSNMTGNTGSNGDMNGNNRMNDTNNAENGGIANDIGQGVGDVTRGVGEGIGDVTRGIGEGIDDMTGTEDMSNDSRGLNRNVGDMNGNENNMMENNQSDVPDDVKSQVERIVREVEGKVDRVHVSTDKGFHDTVKGYSSNNGKDQKSSGMFEKMGNMIEDVFPENTGNKR